MGVIIKKEKEILLFDWDDILFPGILVQAAHRLWPGGCADIISDYSLPSEWNDIVIDLAGQTDGQKKLQQEEELLLRQFLPLLPGAREVLEELQGRWRLFAAGSASSETTELGMRLAGWHNVFEETISGSDLEKGKPHPEIYLRALDRAGAEENDAYLIVGSRRGAEAASRSGISYLLLANSQMNLADPLVRGAKDIFWELRELPRWL